MSVRGIHRTQGFQTGLRVLGLLAVFGVAGGASASFSEEPPPPPEADTRPPAGIVILEVAPGSALERAGLHAGDSIVAWERGPAGAGETALETFLDWLWLEAEQAPRGAVTLIIERQGEGRRLAIPPGRWEAKVEPRMEETHAAHEAVQDAEREARHKALLARLLAGELKESREFAPAAETLRAALDGLAAWEQESLLAAAIRYDLGGLALEQRELPAAREWLEASLAIRQRLAPGSVDEADSSSMLGTVALLADDFALAEARSSAALRIYESIAPGGEDVAKSLNVLGVLSIKRGETAKATDYLGRVLAIHERLAPGGLAAAKALNNLGILAKSQGDFKSALDFFERSLAIRQKLAPGTLDESEALNNLGALHRQRGDPDRAQSYFAQALAIKERLAPASLDLAGALVNFGLVLKLRGDLDGAERTLRRALAIGEKLAPGGHERAIILGNLASVAQLRGDFTGAEDLARQALALSTKIHPDGVDVASNLNRLGDLAWMRGNSEEAEEQFRKALEIYERAAPKSLGTADSWNGLANVALSRGDWDAAADSHERALAIRQAATPDGPSVAASLINLANIRARRGDLAVARTDYERALALFEKIAPETLETTFALANLGAVVFLQGDEDLAQRLFERSLRINERLAPGSLREADNLKNLAEVASHRGDLGRARTLYERALVSQNRLAPGSTAVAETLHDLAAVLRRAGEPAAALPYLLQALAALETQIGRLGGSDFTRIGFRARYASYYREALDLLLELERPEEAFLVLERSRARGLLAMLIERDLVFSADIPPALETRRRTVTHRYKEVERRIAEAREASDAPGTKTLVAELTDLRRQHEEVAAEIRRISPRLATLQYPAPLDVAGAQAALDPGTLLLSYSVGPAETHLFALEAAGPLTVVTLAGGEDALRSEVETFLETLVAARPGSVIGEARRGVLEARARSLYWKLLGPVLPLIQKSERLLLVPDGPLERLPWGALRREAADVPQFVSEWKPLHLAPSATVFAELKRSRRPAGERSDPELAAFGDPLCGKPAPTAVPLTGEARPSQSAARGRSCEPLPAARAEVTEIGRLFPDHARLYLGGEATEEKAKALGRDVRSIHFATHAILDARFPLDSALVLTQPEIFGAGRDNGLLQAWEVFEQVRLDADLVVLSACESGLGKEMGGEGLVGLTRAFQYAGARSVLASLWKISDRTTAELMTRFYRHLKDGMAKDEALRAAQTELIQGPIRAKNEKGEDEETDASAPYYWAAFQIYGDWK